MMTDVYQAAGGADDMPGGMPGGGFDGASGPGGNGHDAVLVRGFIRIPIVQHTIGELCTKEGEERGSKVVEVETDWATVKRRTKQRTFRNGPDLRQGGWVQGVSAERQSR